MLKDLRRALQGDALPVYVIHGDEPWLLGQARELALEALRPTCEPASFNFSSHDAGGDSGLQGVQASRTLPMMAQRRLVLIENLQGASKGFLEELVAYVEAPTPSTSLVVIGAKIPKHGRGKSALDKKLLAAAGQAGHVETIKAKDTRPEQVAMAVANELGHDLHKAEAELLVELAGRELSVVVQEVHKACLYADERAPLTEEVITAACTAVAGLDHWALTGAIATRDLDAALSRLHRLLSDGVAEHQLLAMILWQLRQMLRVAEMLRRGVPEQQIRQELRLYRNFSAIRNAVRSGFPGAADVLGRVVQANRELNRSAAGGQAVMESLIWDLCRPAGA